MKLSKFIVGLAFMLFPILALGQTKYNIPENIPANNGDLEWITYKTKQGEVKLDKKGVFIKSSLGRKFGLAQPGCMTYASVPLNMNGDFYISITFKPDKVNEDHPIGFVIDATGYGTSFKTILFDGQFCWYEFGLLPLNKEKYKYVKAKNDFWTVSLVRENEGDYVVYLNGIEANRIPASYKFDNPCVGLFVNNKNSALITQVAYEQYSVPADNE